jgi:hypothetical protein
VIASVGHARPSNFSRGANTATPSALSPRLAHDCLAGVPTVVLIFQEAGRKPAEATLDAAWRRPRDGTS